MNQDSQSSSEKNAVLDQLIAAMRISQNATDMMDEAFAALLGINRTDARCLDIVQRLGRITAGELAQQSGLTTGAVTVVIDRMERAGYLQRLRDVADRRKVRVDLTDSAHDLGRVVFTQISRIGQEGMGRMPAEDMRLVTQFLITTAFMDKLLAEKLRDLCEAGRGTDPMTIAREFAAQITSEASVIESKMAQVWQTPPEGLRSGKFAEAPQLGTHERSPED
jgi:DNA-binding MarR family transcriptional regulator